MALEESRKRKNPSELQENDENDITVNETVLEPDAKVKKIENIDSNLKTDDQDAESPTSSPNIYKKTPEEVSSPKIAEKTSEEGGSPKTDEKIPEESSSQKTDEKIPKEVSSSKIDETPEEGEVVTDDIPTLLPIVLPSSSDETPKPDENTADPTLTNNIINIKFKDVETKDRYKSKFLKFINTFIELETKIHEDGLAIEIYKDDSLNPDEWEICDETLLIESSESSSPTKKRKKKSKAKKELFMVDVTPSANHNREAVDLRYTSKFTINPHGDNDDDDDDKIAKPKGQACFNCGVSGHVTKDCPEPKDYARISEARQKFKPQVKSGRYHSEGESKFGHLKPGQISKELRNAMGLHSDEIPHFVYLMRRLGYPPGWLEEAKFMQSNLEMFGLDEKAPEKEKVKRGLDPAKIVDYPGFNIPLPEGIKDEHRSYGVPSYSEKFAKEAMIEYFNEKLPKNEENEVNAPIVTVHDDVTITTDVDETTLNELEKQKADLLAALDDSNSPIANKTIDNPVQVSIVKTSSFGTPILKSNSPYMKLPNADNFSKDVSPVINFENLPNSIGKYEQMTDVLHKVRDTMKKIQNCDT